jgi:probable O-glycosylation ligase (exosortase A-associated)
MLAIVYTYLLTYGGTVVSLFRPYVGLLIYISFAVVKPQALWFWALPQGGIYSRIVGFGMLLGWLLNGFGNWRWGKARGIVLAYTGFMIWSVFSAAQAPDQDKAWDFVDAMVKIYLPFVVGMTLIDSVRQLKQLAWVVVISQGFIAYEANLAYFKGYNEVMVQGFAGMPDNNGVALTMHTCTAVAFFLGLQDRVWWRKALAFGLAILMVHVVLLSNSREGMLGLIVTAVMTFWLIPKRVWHLIFFSLAVIVGFRLAGPEVRERFSTILVDPEQRDESAKSRTRLWSDAADAMLRKPLFGHGPEHFSLISHEYGWSTGKEAHNLWLKIGAELGVPGLAFLIAFYGLCVVKLWPIARSRAPTFDPWLVDAARMVIASLAGFFVCTQFNNIYGLEIPYYVVLIGAGTLKLISKPVTDLAEKATTTHDGDATALTSPF